jgi:hypothetical protein
VSNGITVEQVLFATKKTQAAEASPGTAAVRREANLPNDDPKANPDIAVTDELDSADAAVISDGLRAYYLNRTGYYDFRPLAVFVRDSQTGKVIGGLHGRSEFGLVYIAWEPRRAGARGIGSRDPGRWRAFPRHPPRCVVGRQ